MMSLTAFVCGCRVVEQSARIPVTAMKAVTPQSKSGRPDPAALQAELQRYSDQFLGRTVAALDDYARSVGTLEARKQALEWKVSAGSAVVSIVSGPNPTANLVDFLALATIIRTALEEWVKSAQGKALEPWLDTSRALETNAWELANGILKSEQQQELRDSIGQWWQSNPTTRNAFFTRPQEFSTLIRQTGEKTARPGSVFALVGLDPTAGLDPAVREVTRTRLFAERAMYTAQRMPFLLRWQIELLTEQLLQGPQLAAVLTNVPRLTESADRLSRATESVSQTAAQLPERVTAERKAILEALATQEGRLRELSVEVSRTLTAGEKMSTSLNATIISFDALMKRFGVGEPDPHPAPDTNSPPFNILDYARTADQLTLMAKELDVLIKDAGHTLDSPALNQRLKDLGVLSDRAKADAKSVLNHAFILGACLILLTFACLLAYRRLAPRGANAPSSGAGLANPKKKD
jgi:hypothetical protein